MAAEHEAILELLAEKSTSFFILIGAAIKFAITGKKRAPKRHTAPVQRILTMARSGETTSKFGDAIRNPTPAQGYGTAWTLPTGVQVPLCDLSDHVLAFEVLLNDEEQPLFLALDENRLLSDGDVLYRAEQFEKADTVPGYLDVTIIPKNCQMWVITGLACSRDDVLIRLRSNRRQKWKTFGGPLLRAGLALTAPLCVPMGISLFGVISMLPGIDPPKKMASILLYGVITDSGMR
jgi:hypothetical protein